MSHTCSKHSLDEIFDIAEYDSEPLRIARLGCKWFDLDTLHHWCFDISRERMVEDRSANIVNSSPQRYDRLSTYAREP